MGEKRIQKRCNTCSHFKYGINPVTQKEGYYCETTGRDADTYLEMRKCAAPVFRRKGYRKKRQK